MKIKPEKKCLAVEIEKKFREIVKPFFVRFMCTHKHNTIIRQIPG